jgi:eukaryotic-like serine/threonine-protein kinase
VRRFDPEVGSKLGQYELLAPAGKGGMAQVWAARPHGARGLRHVVAIKTILSGPLDDARLEQMFLQEGAIAPRLEHPNLVKTRELGEHDGVLYLVMDWVDGEPLHVLSGDARDEGGLPLEISTYVLIQALRGLHAAHELCDEGGAPLGLVHRDLSPQNIIVTSEGEVKLVDFGIAKVTAVDSSLTDAGEIKGKYAYVSPEQVGGHAVDRRSDVFAAGVLLYMLTTGRHPFRGQSAAETVKKISSTPALLPSAVSPEFPAALEAVLMRALEKSADARWANAEQMADALERALPVCAAPAFRTRLAEYVKRLSGGRAAERRNNLRLAEERLERQQAAGSNPMLAALSKGSLRALSIDRVGSEIVIHAEADASFDALSLGLTESFQLPPRRVRSLSSMAWGAALLCCGALVGLGARFALAEFGAAAPPRAAAIESPVPNATLSTHQRREPPAPSMQVAAPPSATSQNAAAVLASAAPAAVLASAAPAAALASAAPAAALGSATAAGEKPKRKPRAALPAAAPVQASAPISAFGPRL